MHNPCNTPISCPRCSSLFIVDSLILSDGIGCQGAKVSRCYIWYLKL